MMKSMRFGLYRLINTDLYTFRSIDYGLLPTMLPISLLDPLKASRFLWKTILAEGGCRDSILASHPAAPDSILGVPENLI